MAEQAHTNVPSYSYPHMYPHHPHPQDLYPRYPPPAHQNFNLNVNFGFASAQGLPAAAGKKNLFVKSTTHSIAELQCKFFKDYET